MPYKQQKKNHNAPKNGSPRREHKQSPPDTSPLAPSTVTTNYREIHQNEAEALRSIYGDDFEEVENRRSAWQVGWIHNWTFEYVLLTIVA